MRHPNPGLPEFGNILSKSATADLDARARNPYSRSWLWIPGSLASLAPRNDEVIESKQTNRYSSGEPNVSRYPPRARRHQKAPGLSCRRRRFALSTRRPLHRTARTFQSAAAEGQRGAAEARHG